MGDGPVFVLAGAGTGKTRTLVYLVETGSAPEQMARPTFTRLAGRRRLVKLAQNYRSCRTDGLTTA